MAYKEKRREKRYAVDIPCIVSEVGDMQILDVSRSGIGILGEAGLSEDKQICVTIYNDGDYIILFAHVMSMVEVENKVRYGLEIVSHNEPWLDLVYRVMMQSM